jgi:hypothetical protein
MRTLSQKELKMMKLFKGRVIYGKRGQMIPKGVDAHEFLYDLVCWTVQHSGFDEVRPYIGLSQIGDCERVLYDRAISNGRIISEAEHLRTKLSYELEAALIERIRGMGLYLPGEAISLHDGMVQGNTDGRIGEDILEIKTVSYEAHFPDGKLPRRVWWQTQAYMHYLRRRETIILYLSRADGKLRVYPVRYSDDYGERIEEKVEKVVQAVRELVRPDCACGECADREDRE